MNANATEATFGDSGSGAIYYTFNPIDYAVFLFMLCISSAVGVYFGFFAHGADTTEDYLLGGKRMKIFPVAISLVASQISGISIITLPAEIYGFGVHWFLVVPIMLFIWPFMVWVITPVFYNNNISNVFEYLELRFDRRMREMISVVYSTNLLLILPVYIFLPSLAFAQVTTVNIHLINFVVNSICVFYTMFGGIKAVVWTDVIQGAIMIFTIILLGIVGCQKAGGLAEVFNIAHIGGRLDIDFTFDGTTRCTFWNMVTSLFILWSGHVSINQSCVQRIVSLPSLRKSQLALTFFAVGFIILMSAVGFLGMTMYARYSTCDPLRTGVVATVDRIVPYYVQDILGHVPGMSGLFISCVFSAALSTVSATLNSLSGIVYFDYIKPFVKHTDRRANITMKSIVVVLGIYCVLAGVIVEKFDSILQMATVIVATAYCLTFGVFTIGMLIPKAHKKAMFYSTIATIVLMISLSVGSLNRVHYEMLPTTTDTCPNSNHTMSAFNQTFLTNFTSTSTTPGTPTIDKSATNGFNPFEMSFNWFLVVGTVFIYVLTIALSYILPPEKNEKVDPKLLAAIVQRFVRYEQAPTEELPELLAVSKTQIK